MLDRDGKVQTMPKEMDWEALGYQSGQARAERDGAYFDPMLESMALGLHGEIRLFAGGVVNGHDPADGQTGPGVWERWGAEIAPQVILSLQPDRPQDAQFHADCQCFAEAFVRGYIAALT